LCNITIYGIWDIKSISPSISIESKYCLSSGNGLKILKSTFYPKGFDSTISHFGEYNLILPKNPYVSTYIKLNLVSRNLHSLAITKSKCSLI
jgi:hypothetical protein